MMPMNARARSTLTAVFHFAATALSQAHKCGNNFLCFLHISFKYI